MTTRWTNRTPRVARVTRRAARPVCTAGHGERLDRLGASVDAVATRVEEYNTHIGHVHATAIGDTLEASMERRELSTRLAAMDRTLTSNGVAVTALIARITEGEESRDAKLANLIDVVADLTVRLGDLPCREREAEGALGHPRPVRRSLPRQRLYPLATGHDRGPRAPTPVVSVRIRHDGVLSRRRRGRRCRWASNRV